MAAGYRVGRVIISRASLCRQCLRFAEPLAGTASLSFASCVCDGEAVITSMVFHPGGVNYGSIASSPRSLATTRLRGQTSQRPPSWCSLRLELAIQSLPEVLLLVVQTVQRQERQPHFAHPLSHCRSMLRSLLRLSLVCKGWRETILRYIRHRIVGTPVRVGAAKSAHTKSFPAN
jgi:hypothetical protein